jgi:hypothetical protein
VKKVPQVKRQIIEKREKKRKKKWVFISLSIKTLIGLKLVIMVVGIPIDDCYMEVLIP